MSCAAAGPAPCAIVASSATATAPAARPQRRAVRRLSISPMPSRPGGRQRIVFLGLRLSVSVNSRPIALGDVTRTRITVPSDSARSPKNPRSDRRAVRRSPVERVRVLNRHFGDFLELQRTSIFDCAGTRVSSRSLIRTPLPRGPPPRRRSVVICGNGASTPSQFSSMPLPGISGAPGRMEASRSLQSGPPTGPSAPSLSRSRTGSGPASMAGGISPGMRMNSQSPAVRLSKRS